MIRTELEGTRICPRIYCDKCGERIDNHAEANVQLHENGRYRIVHRACDTDREGVNGWYQLDHFLFYLIRNVHLSLKDLEQIEESFEAGYHDL